MEENPPETREELVEQSDTTQQAVSTSAANAGENSSSRKLSSTRVHDREDDWLLPMDLFLLARFNRRAYESSVVHFIARDTRDL